MTDQDQANEQPEISVDMDWKAQAQAEKEKLQQQVDEKDAQQQNGKPGQGGQQLPPADFRTLVSSLVTQALLYMGAIPDPSTGQSIVHPELARHNIDLIGVLEEKTRGNLSEEETKLINQILHELRMSYMQMSQQMADQMASSMPTANAPTDTGADGIQTPTA